MGRKLLILVGVALAAALSGCGSSSSSPLGTELSYVPRDSVFLAAVPTDPHGSLVHATNKLIASSPGTGFSLGTILAAVGLDYQNDIQPLFGNPVVVSVARSSSTTGFFGSPSVLGVWVVHSQVALNALLAKLGSPSKASGVASYHLGQLTLAVKGRTVLMGTPTVVQAALARHSGGHGMTTAEFSGAGGSVAPGTVLQAIGDLAGVIHGSALKVPWIRALRGYTARLTGSGTSVRAQFRLDTSGAPLTPAEIPFTTATGAPELAGTMPITVGVRDPGHSFAFLEAAYQSSEPGSYAKFARQQAAAKRRTGYDLDTFFSLLTGNAIIETDGHGFLARADVTDPTSAARQLALLPQAVHDVFPTAHSITRRAGGFLQMSQTSGKPIEFGLVGREFVAGLGATAAQLRAFAQAPTTPAASATGPLAIRIDVAGLLAHAVKQLPTTVTGPYLSLLGDLTGSVSDSPTALSGGLALAVK